MPASTYSLYQSHFEILAEVMAYYELGMIEEATELIEETLEADRGKYFDADLLTAKVNKHKVRIEKLLAIGKEYGSLPNPDLPKSKTRRPKK